MSISGPLVIVAAFAVAYTINAVAGIVVRRNRARVRDAHRRNRTGPYAPPVPSPEWIARTRLIRDNPLVAAAVRITVSVDEFSAAMARLAASFPSVAEASRGLSEAIRRAPTLTDASPSD